jgi:hypothetical protein
VKYDDASWHYGGDFPEDIPGEAGATHIGMFVAWAVLNGLAGLIHTDDFAEGLARLRDRQVTPGAWFIEACDDKFTEDLNDEGNAFAQAYYADGAGMKTGKPSYLGDCEVAFPGLDTLYRIPDTWQSYEILAATVTKRFLKWRSSQKGWRRFFS